MNGYLNNLTLRTLNSGNRIEPRLPSFFEPKVFDSAPPSLMPYEEDVSIVNSTEPHQGDREEVKDRFQTRDSGRVMPDEDEKSFSISSRSDPPTLQSDVNAAEAPPASRSLGARKPPETFTSFESEDSGIERSLSSPQVQIEYPATTSALEDRGSLQPSSAPQRFEDPFVEVEEERLVEPSIKVLPQPPPAVLIPQPFPETDHFQARITLGKTTPNNVRVHTTETAPVTSIEPGPSDENSEIELPHEAEDFRSSRISAYSRVNSMPAAWRDQPSPRRRRQPVAPIDPEPSINVTIGRVEVRAVQTSDRKTNSPRRSESPVMPLEDYLRKQRRGGER